MTRLRATGLALVGVATVWLVGCGQDPRLATLGQRVLDLKAQLADAQSARDEAHAQAKALSAEADTVKNQLSMTTAELVTATNSLDATRQKLATANSRLGEATMRAEAIAGHIGVPGLEDAELSAMVDVLGRAYMEARQHASAGSAQAKQTTEALARLHSRLQAAEHSRDYLSRQVNQLLQTRDALRDGWAAERQRNEQIRAQSAEAQAGQAQAREQLKVARDAKTYLEEQVDYLEGSRQALSTELEARAQTDEELKSLKVERDAMTAANAAQASDLQRLAEAEAYLYRLFEKKALDLNDARKQLKALRTESGELAATLADALAERDALQTELNATAEDAKGIGADLAATRKELEAAAARGDAFQAQLEATRQQLQSVADAAGLAAADAERRVAGATQAAEQLEQQVVFVTNEVRTALAQADAAETALASERAAAAKRLQQAESLLAPMTAQRNELLQMLGAANQRIADLEAKVGN